MQKRMVPADVESVDAGIFIPQTEYWSLCRYLCLFKILSCAHWNTPSISFLSALLTFYEKIPCYSVSVFFQTSTMPSGTTQTLLQLPHPPAATCAIPYKPAAQIIHASNLENKYQGPHLLGVALEIRETIYSYIIDSIQANRTVPWSTNVTTEYDGVRLVCRQLYRETWHRVFNYIITSQQLGKLLTLPLTKQTFIEVRMLTIQIDNNMGYIMMTGLCEALNALQLSIQELHLLFIGKDLNGVETSVHGCGNIPRWGCESHQNLLLLSGQRLDEKRFDLLRQLSLMRQLRVLRVENANIPLNQGTILVNKPHLEALNVTSDPRSVAHNYATVNRRYLKNLMTVIRNVPDVKALQLTANAVMPASGIVNKLARRLEHFSWTVPNFEYQVQAESRSPHDFYEETASVIHTLSWQAPRLWALRLCIDMRERPCPTDPSSLRDHNVMAADLHRYLPRFSMLQHLEIHYSGGTGFFRDELIRHLPRHLKRLYITDSTIAPDQLVKQVRQRYFKPKNALDSTYLHNASIPMVGQDKVEEHYEGPLHCLSLTKPKGSVMISFDRDGRVYYLSDAEQRRTDCDAAYGVVCNRSLLQEEDFLEEPGQFCGELRWRTDTIPSGWDGMLGFVTYEYNLNDKEFDDAWYTSAPNGEWESDTTKIVRLSGKLLDRERHTHLRYKKSVEVLEGIESFRILDPSFTEESQYEADIPETAQYSQHPGIYAAIYNTDDLAPKPFLVEKNTRALGKCLNEHWYFGAEAEALKVFNMEPSAKVEDQRPRSMVDVVNSPQRRRCRWMSPDYPIVAVGSHPAPVIPDSWRSRTYK